jgi:hypothetical protein
MRIRRGETFFTYNGERYMEKAYHKYEGLYPRCPICGFIDYENAYWETDLGIVHDACGN